MKNIYLFLRVKKRVRADSKTHLGAGKTTPN
jgi:hypothetical protein